MFPVFICHPEPVEGSHVIPNQRSSESKAMHASTLPSRDGGRRSHTVEGSLHFGRDDKPNALICHPERSRGISSRHPERSRGISSRHPERSRGISEISPCASLSRDDKPLRSSRLKLTPQFVEIRIEVFHSLISRTVNKISYCRKCNHAIGVPSRCLSTSARC